MKPTLILKAPELRKYARKIADAIARAHGPGCCIVPRPAPNPTLVAHGLVKASLWHITTADPPIRAVADLYVGSKTEAARVTRLLANLLKSHTAGPMRLRLLDNTATPAELKGHPSTTVEANPSRSKAARARRRATRAVKKRGRTEAQRAHKLASHVRRGIAHARSMSESYERSRAFNPSRSKAARSTRGIKRALMGRRRYKASVRGRSAKALYYARQQTRRTLGAGHPDHPGPLRPANPKGRNPGGPRIVDKGRSWPEMRALAERNYPAGNPKGRKSSRSLARDTAAYIRAHTRNPKGRNPAHAVTALVYRSPGVPGYLVKIMQGARVVGVGEAKSIPQAQAWIRKAVSEGGWILKSTTFDSLSRNPKGRICGKLGKAYHDCLHGRKSGCACANPVSRTIDKRSIRTIVRGGKSMLVGCPKGSYQPRKARCRVGTRRVNRRKGGARRTTRHTRRTHARVSNSVSRRRPNPATEAAQLVRMFQDRGPIPVKTKRLKAPKPLKGAVAKIGDVAAIVYTSNKFDGKRKDYEHEFKSPKPVLVADPATGDLNIVRGQSNYELTPDGIIN